MTDETITTPIAEILTLIEEKHWQSVRDGFSTLLPADKVLVFQSLSSENQQAFLSVIKSSDTADIMDKLEDQEAASVANLLSSQKLIGILSQMRPDEAANLLGDLEIDRRQELLKHLPEEEKLRSLLQYPDDTAGGLMTYNYYSFSEEMPSVEILRRLRAQQARDEEIPYIYAVDSLGRLRGVAWMTDLIRAHPDEPLKDIAKTQYVFIKATKDQETAARLLNRYDLLALPVVDEQQRLIGVITADDAMAVLQEETSEDIYRSAGIITGRRKQPPKSDMLIRGPVWQVWLVRVPFLLITMVGGMLAGIVIEFFQPALEAVVILSVFIPIIMDMGGNAGVQSTSIFIRGYVLGQIDSKRFWFHLLREMLIGIGIGVVLGISTGIVAFFWINDANIGWVVGLSLICTMTLATILGFSIPFILTKLNIDPTAGSSPLITTIKDITGLFIYFGFATLFLNLA